jgi:hypothetical protein
MAEKITPGRDFTAYFAVAPTEIKPFSPLSPVEREQFVGMLEWSFRFSRGSDERQYLLLSWMQSQNNFPWEPALQTFVTQGGWNVLTAEERAYFIGKFEKIKAHKTVTGGRIWQGMHRDPARTSVEPFELLFDMPVYRPDLVTTFEQYYGELPTITSEKDFLQCLYHYLPLEEHSSASSADD